MAHEKLGRTFMTLSIEKENPLMKFHPQVLLKKGRISVSIKLNVIQIRQPNKEWGVWKLKIKNGK